MFLRLLFKKVVILSVFLFLTVNASYSKEIIEGYKYNNSIILKGVVASLPQSNSKKIKFIFYTERYGKILISSKKYLGDYLKPGNILDIKVKLSKIIKTKNYNSFSYSDYLNNKNIVATGQIIDDSIKEKGFNYLYSIERFRYNIQNIILNDLEKYKNKALILALLIGDKSSLKKYNQLLKETGTSHLFVISGLHIGLIALVGFLFFRLLWSFFPKLCRFSPAQNIAVLGSLFVALFYSLLAGFSVSTQRALLMLVILSVFFFLKRKVSILKSLFIAFIIIILFNYKNLYSPGLWLSFSAVIFLVILSINFQNIRNKYFKGLVIQFYLLMFLIPLTVFYFDAFSISAILANLLAIPLISFIIVPFLLIGLIFSFLGIKLWFISEFFINFLLKFLNYISLNIPYIDYWRNLSILSLMLIILGLFLIILPFYKSLRFLGLALILIFFQEVNNYSEVYKQIKITAFDIDNSTCILIQDEGEITLYINKDILNNKYAVNTILKTYFKLYGISKIDNIIFTDSTYNKLNLKLLKNITEFEKNNIHKCKFSNNWQGNNSEYRLFKVKNKCILDFKKNNTEITFIPKLSKNEQNLFNKSYSRMIIMNVIFSPTLLINEILKNDYLKYYVYISNKNLPMNFKNKMKKSLKILDFNKNGSLELNLNLQGITINSLLK